MRYQWLVYQLALDCKVKVGPLVKDSVFVLTGIRQATLTAFSLCHGMLINRYIYQQNFKETLKINARSIPLRKIPKLNNLTNEQCSSLDLSARPAS